MTARPDKFRILVVDDEEDICEILQYNLQNAGYIAHTAASSEEALFKMKNNYDCWFAGASEFFVKIGSLKDFTASTEAELKLYNPEITDFLVVVKRDQVGITLPVEAMLISDWSEQMTHCAFMITEDDGGTWTEWKCTALVRVASKSYGVELNIPVRTWDDIVWRGRLAWDWLDANSGQVGHFGDVDLTFAVEEY